VGFAARVSLVVSALTALLVCITTSSLAQVRLPENTSREAPVSIRSDSATHWIQGAYEVWVLRGNCLIRQGSNTAQSDEAVVWIDRNSPHDIDDLDEVAPLDSSVGGFSAVNLSIPSLEKAIVYLEGNVIVDSNRGAGPVKLIDTSWLGRYYTHAKVEVRSQSLHNPLPAKPDIYRRGVARRNPPQPGAIRRTQYTAFGPESNLDESSIGSSRRIRAFPRSDVAVQAQWFPDRTNNQWIAVINSGVNLIVDGVGELGSIDISTDRLVLWTTGSQEPDLTGQTLQDGQVPLELYMEGNIIFRQGERIIYAQRMYYNVTNKTGTILDAEMLTPVEELEGGLIRLKSKIVQQLEENKFFAQDSFVTSSRMGQPGYRLQAGDIYFEDIQRPMFNPFTGQPVIDPLTGQHVIGHERLATSRDNFLFLGPVPVFYWPIMATDLKEPSYYIRRARLKKDSVFGTQIFTSWHAYELLGIENRPVGTDWDFNLDYLSKRGIGHGTAFRYNRESFLTIPGSAAGLADYWGIRDRGTDNLGALRRSVEPPKNYRWRTFWQHRQLLLSDSQLTAEFGWISDRNFLEEYFEREWDQLKDESTGLELKRSYDNVTWSLEVDYRLNAFFTETEWLPRLNHFCIGQPLLHDSLTWYEHSSAGYAKYRIASEPTAPEDIALFELLPWEVTSKGEVLVTRQEIDWPLQMGVVKTVPYALGELARWGQDLNGEPLNRGYWQAGVRASMPMWRVNPNVDNAMWDIHGLAHKIVFDIDFSVAQSNVDEDDLPLYDPLNDNNIESFQRSMIFTTFNGPGTVPGEVDPRKYALRAGLPNWVSSPTTEIAGDMTAMRMGMRHRLQTKRGMPGKRQIMDWMVFDTHATWFPDAARDNFNKSVGLVDYDYRWHLGDRFTFTSNGSFDFFDDGQQIVSVGGFLSRPPRGRLYVGFHMLGGPIRRNILSISYDYRMSPKWASAFSTSFDLGNEGNIGQNLSITRIGESLLISAGLSYNSARETGGFMFLVEPRFLPGRLGRVGGAQIPVAGTMGLE